MEFRLLGPLEVRAGDGTVPLGAPKQRALLAFLLLHANRVVAQERLIDELWGESPPVTAPKSVQGYVSRLRKVLPTGTLVTRRPGYVLEVEPDALDVARFERLVAEAHSAEPARAATLLREALGLWRGPPLGELQHEPFARLEAERLEDVRLAALEQRIEADLALGRHEQLAGELEALVREHPHRERLRGQLMLALYRSDRQADALEAYRDARDALDQLGLEPGAALRRLERQILTQDASLDTGSGPAALPGPLVPASPFPFVGRSRELGELRTLLERAEAGEGGFVLLGAEAGGGKTRLVRELAHEAAARDVLVLYGVADAVVTTPHQPLREWLEALLRAGDEALAECLGAGSEVLARLVPELQRLTGPAPPPGATADDRYLLQLAAVELLRRLGARGPLLLVAEDVHWADGDTLHLLRRLARSAPEGRLVVVASYRDEDGEIGPAFADALADLSRADGVLRLALDRLGDEDVAAFVTASTDAQPSTELTATLGALTGGTPLLLCELWRDLRESGGLEVTGGGVALTRSVSELRGPERLRDLVRQRLARLGPEAAAILELAAVIGPRFELDVLAAAAALEQRVVAALVSDAARRGLVEALPEPQPACRFTHELVRRAVYDRIEGLHRAELHLRVGEALERAHAAGQAAILPELAHHFTLAVPAAGIARAVEYNLRAAEAALAAAAYDVAAEALSTALGLGIADPRDEARAGVELAFLLADAGRYPEAEEAIASSLDSATGLEERGLAAHALLRRISWRAYAPDTDPALDAKLAEQVLQTFAEAGDVRGLSEAEWILGGALRRQGRLADAAAAFEPAAEHAEAASSAAQWRRAIGSLALVLGDGPTPVVDALRRCEELRASSGGDRTLDAVVGRILGGLHAMAGHADEARDELRRSSLVLDELDLVSVAWAHRGFVAEARVLLGDRAGAEHELVETWRKFTELGGDGDGRAMQAAYRLALLCCDGDRWDEAEHWLEYGRDVPLPSGLVLPSVLGLATRGRIAAHLGDTAEAVALAGRAVELAELSDMLNFRALVWLALAEAQRAGGRSTEADASRATAIALYEQKGNVAAAAPLRGASALST